MSESCKEKVSSYAPTPKSLSCSQYKYVSKSRKNSQTGARNPPKKFCTHRRKKKVAVVATY